MPQPQGVTEFMQRHAEQVRVRADLPGFISVEMHIAGDRLRIWGGGIKRMRENRGAGKRKAVSMIAAGEENVDGLRSGCVRALLPRNLNDVGPLRHGPLDGRLRGARRELIAKLAEDIANRGGVMVRSSPARTVGRDQLSGDAEWSKRVRVGTRWRASDQIVPGREDVGYGVLCSQLLNHRERPIWIAGMDHQVLGMEVWIFHQLDSQTLNHAPGIVQVDVPVNLH